MTRQALLAVSMVAVGLALVYSGYGFGIKEEIGNVNISGPRGLRNNNPGNIRRGPSLWRGRSRTQRDASFVQFTSSKWGIRALGKILLNYNRFYRLNTVAGIINRFAPSSENNTSAYINAVAREVGVRPDQKINVRQVLPALIAAIIHHENGQQPYSDAQIIEGIGLI